MVIVVVIVVVVFVKKKLGPKKSRSKNVGSKKNLGPKMFCTKNVAQTNLGKFFFTQQIVGTTNIWVQKVKKIGYQKVWQKKYLGKNVGQQDLKPPKKLGPKSLVKLRLVTSEILLIWINVTRTYVAWTNVTSTVGICSSCSQETTFKVSSKLGQ